MNCANCGGGLEPVGNRNYFRCRYCQTFHFPAETGDGVAVTGDAAGCDCPVCKTALSAAAVRGQSVLHCTTCRGVLMSNGTFGQVVRLKRADARPVGEPLPFDPAELNRPLACPKCRERMDTHPYHAGGNAVIDTCFRCHLIWLDAGELTVISRYAAGRV